MTLAFAIWHWEPQPVTRVEIRKPEGGMRKLGIPGQRRRSMGHLVRGQGRQFVFASVPVLDRFIQQAVMQVLQKQWDPAFSEDSYGFRPKRSAPQAVARAQQYIAAGFTQDSRGAWTWIWRNSSIV